MSASTLLVEPTRAQLVMVETLLRLKARKREAERPKPDALTWATEHRRINGQPFRVVPPLEDVYRDTAEEVVIKKAAQVFVSELCINLAFWTADTRQGGRGNVLYIFPAIQQLGDFVRARIDKAIEESAYLQQRVKPTKGLEGLETARKSTDNLGLKRLGGSFLYFRGSNAEAGLISVDADLVVYDEVDRLREGTLAMGSKRLGSSLLRWQRYASTPKYPEVGIDALWLASDRRQYHVRCERCGEWQPLVFPDNVLEDGEVVCRACRNPVDRLARGEWVAECPGRDIHGYHMTKLLSPRANVAELARLGYRILRREVTDPSVIQEFYNQDLGLAHAPEGGQLSRAEIEACVADYSLDEWAPRGCYMGVDIGARLHIRIDGWGPNGKLRAAFIGTVPSFDDLPGLMARFDVSCCVVDALPEGHSARQFARKFPGRVWLCHYPNTATWGHQEAVVWNEEEGTVNAHRTLTLDAMFGSIRERRVEYPREVMHVPEFAEQLMAPVRVIEKDATGNLVARYVEGGKADHFAHANNYCSIAANRRSSLVVSPEMFSVMAGRNRR